MAETGSVSFFKRTDFRAGLMGGGFVSLLYLAYYLSGGKLFNDLMFAMIIPFFALLGFGIYAGVKKREMRGGILPFADALGAIMIAFLTGLLLSQIFMVVLLIFIDPTIIQKTTELRLIEIQKAVNEGKAKQQELDAFKKSLTISGQKGMALQQSFIYLIIMSAIGMVFGLLGAVFVRRERPA